VTIELYADNDHATQCQKVENSLLDRDAFRVDEWGGDDLELTIRNSNGRKIGPLKLEKVIRDHDGQKYFLGYKARHSLVPDRPYWYYVYQTVERRGGVPIKFYELEVFEANNENCMNEVPERYAGFARLECPPIDAVPDSKETADRKAAHKNIRNPTVPPAIKASKNRGATTTDKELPSGGGGEPPPKN
jgi:hypothetical protein